VPRFIVNAVNGMDVEKENRNMFVRPSTISVRFNFLVAGEEIQSLEATEPTRN
jgi:hypothetical protein